MAYQLVDFSTNDLADQIQKQKDLDSYDAPGFDPTVLQELKKLVDAAVKMEETLATKIQTEHRTAKQQMDLLEALIKKRGKSLSVQELAGIDRMVVAIKNASDAAEKEALDAKAPLLPWRESWPDHWRKLVSDPKKLDVYVAKRKAAIDASPALVALRDRMKEYTKRSVDMQKAAKQLVTKVNQSAGNEANEIRTFATEVKSLTDKCVKAGDTKVGSYAILAMWLKTAPKIKKPSADDIKSAQEMLTKIESSSKGERGALKSLETKLATFKKTAARFDGQNRKNALTAYSEAGKSLKKAQAGVKTLTSNQAKAAKLVASWTKKK